MKKVKELLILRHGKSDWSTDTTDFYRPLKQRGNRNAKQIGIWLKEQNLLPDLIMSSPAIRALDTTKKSCNAMGLPVHLIKTDKSIYAAELSDLLLLLSETPSSVHRLLLVGHNPGLEDLLNYLVPGIPIPEDGKLLPTATLAYLQLDQQWTSLIGNYIIQRAKDLP